MVRVKKLKITVKFLQMPRYTQSTWQIFNTNNFEKKKFPLHFQHVYNVKCLFYMFDSMFAFRSPRRFKYKWKEERETTETILQVSRVHQPTLPLASNLNSPSLEFEVKIRSYQQDRCIKKFDKFFFFALKQDLIQAMFVISSEKKCCWLIGYQLSALKPLWLQFQSTNENSSSGANQNKIKIQFSSGSFVFNIRFVCNNVKKEGSIFNQFLTRVNKNFRFQFRLLCVEVRMTSKY